MSKETPYYVKRNALISTGLIIPFFVVVFFPGILRQNMSASAAFQTSLFISLILLPSLAFVLATTTFLAWSKSDKKPLWRGLLDVRRSWLLTAVGTLALTISLFVPFHDSVHCVVGNPVRVVHNPSQTWQCVDDGFLGGR